MALIYPKKDWFSELSSDVSEKITPLKKIGINFFSYVRIYPDNSRIDITNCPNINKHYYNKKEKLYEEYIPENNIDEFNTEWVYLGNPNDDPTIKMMKDTNDATHVLSMIDKTPTYTDIFNYGMPTKTTNAFQIYKSNFNLLKLFSSDFLLTFERKIAVPKEKRILLLNPQKKNSQYFLIKENIDTDLLECPLLDNLNSINLGNGFWLTKSEFLTCYHLKSGYSPQRIARIMGVTSRTVNRHLSNSCFKINAVDYFHLISLLARLPIFTTCCRQHINQYECQ